MSENFVSIFRAPAANLRNGVAARIAAVHLTAGIPEAYHWIDPSIGITVDVDGEPDANTDPYLMIGRVAAIYMHFMAASEADAAKRARKAMYLAAARLAVACHWEIRRPELIAAQVRDIDMVWAADGSQFGAPRVTTGPTAEDIRAQLALLPTADAVFGGKMMEEWLGLVARAALGMPVCQGVVLYKTLSHHFVDPYKPVARAVLSEVFGRGSGAGGIAELTRDEFEDIICHKACHPILNSIMIGAALDEDTVARMRAVGLASAVVRVPAKSDVESLLSAAVRIVDSAASLASTANVDVGNGANALKALARDTTTSMRAAADASGRVRADLAARAALATFEADVAFCGGMFAEAMGSGPSTSLLQAKGITRIMAENPVSVKRGRDVMAAAAVWSNDRVRAGALPGYAIFGGTVPPPMTAAPAATAMPFPFSRADGAPFRAP